MFLACVVKSMNNELNSAKFLILIFLATASLAFCEESENTVHVYGKKFQDRLESNERRKTVTFRPKSTLQADSETLLHEESAIQTEKKGDIHANGFTVPKIRGQDSKVTEIFLEGFRLQNPYTGLPISEEVDLNGLGQLSIYYGLTPYDIGSTNPVGSMHYHVHRATRTQTKIGLEAGYPYGQSAWFKHENPHILGSNHYAQFFFRDHRSRGTYPFYDDNQTPYNTEDDRTSLRKNNDVHSRQWIPYYRHQLGPIKTTYMGWLFEKEKGIPPLSNTSSIRLREKDKAQLHAIRWEIDLANPNLTLVPDFLDLGLLYKRNSVELKDPNQQFLVSTSKNRLDIKSVEWDAKTRWDLPWANLVSGALSTSTDLSNHESGHGSIELSRTAFDGFWGGNLSLFEFVSLEFKIQRRLQRDRVHNVLNTGVFYDFTENEKKAWSGGRSVLVNFEARSIFSNFYAQYGQHERAPALIESFGNGSTIRPNATLFPEKLTHSEVGWIFQPDFSTPHLHLIQVFSLYRDRYKDKIVIVNQPSGVSKSKAFNLGHSHVDGMDSSTSLSIQKTNVLLSVALLRATDDGNDEKLIIPGIAQRQCSFRVTQAFPYFDFYWLTRYRGELFQDIRNRIQIKPVWIHDVGIHGSAELNFFKHQWGLKIENLLDQRKMGMHSDQGEEGFTGISDIRGSPLPGRTYKLTYSLAF